MRIIRFLSAGREYFGQPIDARTARRFNGNPFTDGVGSFGDTLPIDKLLAPIVPTDILCIGLNYREHAAESGSAIPENPVLFIKASNTLNHPFDPIPLPRLSDQVDYECELAVVIGRTAKHVSRADALD